MAKILQVFVLLVIMCICTLMAGCTTQLPAAVPTIKITSPANGATLPAGNVTVTVQVSNFSIVDKQGQANVPGEGHVHFYMDVSPIPSDPTKPAIPANASAVWAHVSGTTYTFTNVPAGTHTFTVQLANNDHTPVIPLAVDSVTVTVTGPAGEPSVIITAPQNGTTVPAGNVTVNAQVSNFNVVDKQGQASVPGEGHLHFYMDVSPIPSDPTKPAIPANASAVWAHVSGTTYTFTNVPAGTHTFTVQLANNDHTPVIPLAVDSVTVTVTGPPATTVTTVPTTQSSSGGGY